MRALLHYALAGLILTCYGVEVCPFMDGLGLAHLGSLISLALALGFAIRGPAYARFVAPRSFIDQPAAAFRVELCLFLAAGAAVTAYNAVALGFPVVSGLKLLLGAATLGLFAAADLALAHARRVGQAAGERPGPPPRALSLPKKLSLGASLGVLFVGGVVTLLIVKDVQWLTESGNTDLAAARMAVFTELLFVGVVVLGHALNLIASYAANLRVAFDRETDVLEAVASGDLSRRVPVTSGDEFGQIAHHTNVMITGLRERDEVKALFGKVVSPEVARRLLADGGALGGQRRTLVILMSDVRGFTARVERSEPESVVGDLNRYFSRMVEIVDAHGGVVDKFIGDGLLAVFGLDGAPDPARRAVAAAQAMLAALDGVNEQLSAPFEIGVAVHLGEVVAGAIGGAQRLEFTVIGDAVNLTARLEGLTRALPASLVISRAVFDVIQPAAGWRALGAHQVKGRSEPVEVHGWSKPLSAHPA